MLKSKVMTKFHAASLLVAGLLGACSTGGSSPATNEAAAAPAPPGAKVASPADPRESKLSAAVVDLLQDRHLRKHKIDDAVSREAFTEYMDRLDPGKMFLLASDAESLRKYQDRIDDQLRSGQLALAHEGSALFVRRVAVVEKMVAEILAKPLDTSNEEMLETDSKKIALATTEAELKDRWRKRLELEVLEKVAAMEEPPEKDDDAPPRPRGPVPATPELREEKARSEMRESYAARFVRLKSRGPLDAAAMLTNAVIAIFDPHSQYLPPAEKANFDLHMTGSLEGIGAVLREDEHYISVVEVVPGGPSWRQGRLEAGDLILSVAQEGKQPVDTNDMRLDEVVRMVRGPKGSIVTLAVKKSTGQVETIVITRDVVVIEDSYARGATLQLKGGKQFGYIYLPSFYGSSTNRTGRTDVEKLLGQMRARKLSGVILDLRGNGGGLLGDSVDLAGLFFDRGPVVQTQVYDGKRSVLSDDDSGAKFDGTVIVMVDRFSASASEIVAGALQDYHRAVIVGTGATHGKGTVQIIADLDRVVASEESLGVVKLTVQQFFRVNGESTQWKGVVPDIVLPDPAGHVESGERSLEHSIPFSKIEPLSHQDWPNASWKIPDLVAKSAVRVAKNDTFSKINARVKLFAARKDDTKVPLQKQAWLAKRKELKTQLDAISPNLDEGPERFSVTIIDYDGSKPVEARPGGKVDDRGDKWKKNLSRDPWIEEALYILADMTPR
jgi:carboxyl-terminal processing protease